MHGDLIARHQAGPVGAGQQVQRGKAPGQAVLARQRLAGGRVEQERDGGRGDVIVPVFAAHAEADLLAATVELVEVVEAEKLHQLFAPVVGHVLALLATTGVQHAARAEHAARALRQALGRGVVKDGPDRADIHVLTTKAPDRVGEKRLQLLRAFALHAHQLIALGQQRVGDLQRAQFTLRLGCGQSAGEGGNVGREARVRVHEKRIVLTAGVHLHLVAAAPRRRAGALAVSRRNQRPLVLDEIGAGAGTAPVADAIGRKLDVLAPFLVGARQER